MSRKFNEFQEENQIEVQLLIDRLYGEVEGEIE